MITGRGGDLWESLVLADEEIGTHTHLALEGSSAGISSVDESPRHSSPGKELSFLWDWRCPGRTQA